MTPEEAKRALERQRERHRIYQRERQAKIKRLAALYDAGHTEDPEVTPVEPPAPRVDYFQAPRRKPV